MNPIEQNLSDEVREIWNRKAPFWDELMGDQGNSFHRTLVEPSILALLDPHPGEVLLDAACGSGLVARRLAQAGAHVTAFDVAETFLDLARARVRRTAPDVTDRIDFRHIDATDTDTLLNLGEGRFHGAVCSMALMDMPEIAPLMTVLPRLLVPGGRFVFVVPHPCFNNDSTVRMVEEEDREGQRIDTRSLKLSEYLTSTTRKGVGALGEPAPHYYFHRPLNVLLSACFRAGFVMDGLLEPGFTPGSEGRRLMSWDHYPEFPPVMAVRMRTRS